MEDVSDINDIEISCNIGNIVEKALSEEGVLK